MRSANWRKARALFWLTLTIVVIVTLLLLGGVFQVAGLPAGDASYLHQFSPWIIVVPILIATKALLELLRPVFRAALRSHVKYEADIFAHFQIVSYVVWATALALVLFVTLGSGASQFGAIGTGVFLGAFVFVMQEPLLNIVGWVVLVTMGLYKLGDRIEMNQSKGYVVEITPMNTTLREFGGLL